MSDVHWKTVPFCEAVEIYDYLREPINKAERQKRISGKSTDELFPYYGATGQVGYIDGYITDGEFVLLGEDGAPFLDGFATKAYIINGKTWVNNHAHILKSKTNNKFLCYYLNSFDYKDYVSGTTRLKLTQGGMRRISIPVPPLPEQERIVAKIEELFSQLDAAVAELNSVKEKLAAYRQAVLKEEFSQIPNNLYKKIKEVIVNGPQNGLYKSASLYGKGVNILRIDGFYSGNITEGYQYKKVQLSDEEIEHYSLHCGDLVINRVNSMQYLGKCALVRKLISPVVFESNMMRLQLNAQKIDGDFLTLFLSSHEGRMSLIKNAKQAVNQASINQRDVLNALIPLPPLYIQQEIVERIKNVLSTCGNIGQVADVALQQAAALRQSILKQAFEGNL